MGLELKNLVNKRILLVEDDQFVYDILINKIRSLGCELIHEKDGNVAIKKVHETKIDLVILDINLPGKSGLEILEDIKKDKGLEKIPVIILSNSDNKEEIQKTQDLGAACFLSKSSIVPNDLLQKMDEELVNK